RGVETTCGEGGPNVPCDVAEYTDGDPVGVDCFQRLPRVRVGQPRLDVDGAFVDGSRHVGFGDTELPQHLEIRFTVQRRIQVALLERVEIRTVQADGSAVGVRQAVYQLF